MCGAALADLPPGVACNVDVTFDVAGGNSALWAEWWRARLTKGRLKKGTSNMMTEALANKSCTPCRGGVPPLTREHAEILLHRRQTGGYQGKLTTSSGVSGFAISGRRLAPLAQ